MFKIVLYVASIAGALCAVVGIVWMFASADFEAFILIGLGALGGLGHLYLEHRYPEP